MGSVFIFQLLYFYVSLYFHLPEFLQVLESLQHWSICTISVWKGQNHHRFYSTTCLETTARRDHLSWRTTKSCQKVLHFNAVQPVTKDHLPWKKHISMANGMNGVVLSFKTGSTVNANVHGLWRQETCSELPQLPTVSDEQWYMLVSRLLLIHAYILYTSSNHYIVGNQSFHLQGKHYNSTWQPGLAFKPA